MDELWDSPQKDTLSIATNAVWGSVQHLLLISPSLDITVHNSLERLLTYLPWSGCTKLPGLAAVWSS